MVAWVVAAVAVPHFLPSLASVTQGNNADFLPASAPSEHAAKLAAPFGTTNVVPVLVLAAQYVSPDGRTVQFATGLKAGDAGSTSALDAVPSIRAEVTRVASHVGAIDSGVGGEAPVLYDVSSISNIDLSRVIPVAILVIGLLLAVVMRSLIAPLYLIASVGLSYLAALGLSVLLFIDIGGSAGLTFILPFLMFIFLLALGEDYNILVMSRIREEARSLPLREAVTRALNATGTTVTSAGLVLAGTFGVFALVGARTSGGSQFVNLAAGLALGILMDTFLVRTLLVPSTVLLLGRWNWWPSKMSRRPAAVPPAGADQAIPAPPPARPHGPPVLDATGDQPEVATDRLSACAAPSHRPG